ncbi:hypothetical protein CF327_g1299 [Tilletia walkeri]|nr:hypothetical protein CF327_g1299 [Tilletia walkeri]
MEDPTLFYNMAAPGTLGYTPSELDTNASLSAFPFFTSPPTLSPFQTMERSKVATPFLSSSYAPKILAESFDAALQALSRHSDSTRAFNASESLQKRPGLPVDFQKPASSIGSSAPSSATSDASDVLADRLDSDFENDLNADSMSLGSNQSGFESWSISPSPVLGNNLQLPVLGPVVPNATGTMRSDSSEMAADIFAQFIAEEDSNGETTDTIRGLPLTTPQRPSLFREFSSLTSASSASTMSMGSSPGTPLDGHSIQRPGFSLFTDMGSPRKSLSSGTRAAPQLLGRSHSQMGPGSFANIPFPGPPPSVNGVSLVADPTALFANVTKHVTSPLPSPAFLGYMMEPPLLSCNPAHIAPSDTVLGRQGQVPQQQQMQQQQPQQQGALPLLRLDSDVFSRASSPSVKRSADGFQTISSSKPAKRVKSESVEPYSPMMASHQQLYPAEAFVGPQGTISMVTVDGRPVLVDEGGEDRPSPVRAVPGFIAQTYPCPSMYMAADMQPDWAASAAAQKCATSTNKHGGSRTAVLGPAAMAACGASASGATASGCQPTPIPVKALIGQHSAATLAHGRPVITASVPLPTYSGIITKRSRGRRVPNDPLEMQNLGKGGKVWTCLVPECGKCFRRSEHLKRHIRSIHTEERPYMCPYPGCKKGFSRHDNLNQHARVHQMADSEGVAMMPSGSSCSSLAGSDSAGSPASAGRKRKQPDGDEDVMDEEEEDEDELEG